MIYIRYIYITFFHFLNTCPNISNTDVAKIFEFTYQLYIWRAISQN
jgi:hypothetical protein